jgi:hypothetical protein
VAFLIEKHLREELRIGWIETLRMAYKLQEERDEARRLALALAKNIYNVGSYPSKLVEEAFAFRKIGDECG